MAYALPGGGGVPPSKPAAYLGGSISFLDPQITTPDYKALLEQYMAPYKSLYDQQLNQLTGQVNEDMSFARRNAELAQQALDESHKHTLQRIAQVLQANGMIQSGDRAYRNHQENDQYARATELAANNLAQLLSHLGAQITGAQTTQQQQLLAQQESAWEFLQRMYQPVVTTNPWTTPTTPLSNQRPKPFPPAA